MTDWVDTHSDARDTCYWKQHITSSLVTKYQDLLDA